MHVWKPPSWLVPDTELWAFSRVKVSVPTILTEKVGCHAKSLTGLHYNVLTGHTW